MSLGGITAGFDSTNPADSDNEGLGAGVIRSLKTTVQQVLDSEHNFPSGGGANTGYHRLGSARAFYDVESNVSSSGTDGRIQVTSDTSRLFHVGSAGTMLLGGQNVISAGSSPVGGQTFAWFEEFGAVLRSAATTDIVSIPHSGYSGIPFIYLTYQDSLSQAACAAAVDPRYVAKTQFGVYTFVTNTGTLSSSGTVYWRSLGTRVL